MKKYLLTLAALTAVTWTYIPKAMSEDTDTAIEQEETASQEVADRPEWTDAMKKKFSLTDEQVNTLKASGLPKPQMAIVAGLATKSGKTIDEVLKMRTEQKMGWGQIAKSLGVAPREIGQSVAGIRHEIRDAKKEARAEKKAAKQEAKAERRQEKMEKRAAKKAEHSNGH